MPNPSKELLAYYTLNKPLVCELEVSPYICEFWPENELVKFNEEYQVPIYAPGYFGFATNGGGEMYAISPTNEIVYLPLIGMKPDVAIKLASTWQAFEEILLPISESDTNG